MSKLCNAKILQIYSNEDTNKLIYYLNGLRGSTFLANLNFGLNYSFTFYEKMAA